MIDDNQYQIYCEGCETECNVFLNDAEVPAYCPMCGSDLVDEEIKEIS